MDYAFDPELAPWVGLLPDGDLGDIALLRQSQSAAADLRTMPVSDGVSADEVAADGVRAWVYTPTLAGHGRPALVVLHSGGFVLGGPEKTHSLSARVAAEVGAVVINVDYRLAPEHPFPAAVEDVYTVLRWTVRHAHDLGIDAERVGVGGDSAGCALAATTTQLARARGGPAIRFQYHVCPVLDDRLDTPSMTGFTDAPLWNRVKAEQSWAHYLAEATTVDGVPAAPARATDLSGLPPAYVQVCQFDPLRDEGIAYAQRLAQTGIGVELHLYPGTFHCSNALVPDAAVSRRMTADLVDAIRRGLARP